MTVDASLDSVLVQWGERLFYPDNRIVKADPAPRLAAPMHQRAAAVLRRIESVVVRRAPQALVKFAGGGRGMRDITAHFKYISRDAAIELEDDRGVRASGKEALRDLADQWRYGGSFIDENTERREALNLVLSMPRGTDPALVLAAARAFAQQELAGNRYVMALHEHQSHPHVHLTVRKESRTGERLQTWKQRHHWRECFAEKLRDLGVDAEATPQAARGELQAPQPLWSAREQKEAGAATRPQAKSGERCFYNRADAVQAWSHIMTSLAASPDEQHRQLASHIADFLQQTPFVADVLLGHERPVDAAPREQLELTRAPGGLARPEPEIQR